MSWYPPEVSKRLGSPQHCGVVDGENASGKDASFECGSFVRFSLRIDPSTKSVKAVRFRTNGCGFMIAAADVLAEAVGDSHLSDLHGLNKSELVSTVEKKLGIFDENRHHCVDCCIRALRSAFAEYRARQIEEFRGEKALICTCFGVTEETIETHIEEKSLQTVDEITLVCNAGGGCGSCRMLIQEMLDSCLNHLR